MQFPPTAAAAAEEEQHEEQQEGQQEALVHIWRIRCFASGNWANTAKLAKNATKTYLAGVEGGGGGGVAAEASDHKLLLGQC